MFKKLGGALGNMAKQQLAQQMGQLNKPQGGQSSTPQQPAYQPQQQAYQPSPPMPPPQITPPAPAAPQGFPNPGEIWAFADPGFRGPCARFSVGDLPNLVVFV